MERCHRVFGSRKPICCAALSKRTLSLERPSSRARSPAGRAAVRGAHVRRSARRLARGLRPRRRPPREASPGLQPLRAHRRPVIGEGSVRAPKLVGCCRLLHGRDDQRVPEPKSSRVERPEAGGDSRRQVVGLQRRLAARLSSARSTSSSAARRSSRCTSVSRVVSLEAMSARVERSPAGGPAAPRVPRAGPQEAAFRPPVLRPPPGSRGRSGTGQGRRPRQFRTPPRVHVAAGRDGGRARRAAEGAAGEVRRMRAAPRTAPPSWTPLFRHGSAPAPLRPRAGPTCLSRLAANDERPAPLIDPVDEGVEFRQFSIASEKQLGCGDSFRVRPDGAHAHASSSATFAVPPTPTRRISVRCMGLRCRDYVGPSSSGVRSRSSAQRLRQARRVVTTHIDDAVDEEGRGPPHLPRS
jgi:hypothetical protein